MDIAGVKETVGMTPKPLFRLVAVPLGCGAAMRTWETCLGADSDVDMDFRFLGIEFSSFDIPRLFQLQGTSQHCVEAIYHFASPVL